MKKSEREAQKKLQELGKRNVDRFVVNKDGVHHDLPRQSPEGVIRDGILRRMAGLPPKRIKE